MRSILRFSVLSAALCLTISLCLMTSSAICAENGGQASLDEATDLQLKAKTLSDWEKIISLTESAQEKGLDDTNKDFAKQLMVSALWQHASRLAGAILERTGVNPRWQAIRELALKDLDKLVAQDEKFVDAYLLRAKLNALPGGKRGDAIKAVDKAVELLGEDKKKKSDALILRSQLRQDGDERKADLDAAVDADPTNSAALQARAGYWIAQGKLDKATEDFEKLLENNPNNSDVRRALCEALINLQKYDLAMAQANKAIELEPNSATNYVLRAQVYEAQEKSKEALADLNKAVEQDSQDLLARFMRARLRYLQDDLPGARSDVDELLRQQPGMVRGILLRSMIAASQGRIQAAIEDVRTLVSADPKNVELRLQLASLYAAAKRPRKAIDMLSELLKEEKDNWMVLRARGDAMLSVGKHEEAIKDYNQALKLKADDDGVLNNLAWVLATSPNDKLRDGRRAVELATKACEATKFEKPHILSTLAAAYAETGDFDNAIKWSTKAVELGKDKLKDQTEQLQKELDSYKKKEPVRELQNVEESPEPPSNVIET